MEHLPSFLNQSSKRISFASNRRIVPDIVSVLGKVLQSGTVPKAKEELGRKILWLFNKVDGLNVDGVCIFKKGPEEEVDANRVDSKSVSDQELASLLSDPSGPGLMIFLWSSTRCSRSDGYGQIQSMVEFDCRGRITKNVIRDHETQYVIEVAEMKRNVKETDGNGQLVLRLRLLQNTLKVALGASNFVLKWYKLFRNGAVQPQYRQVFLEKNDPNPIQLIKMRVKRGEQLLTTLSG
mmetsp:Transcript_39268/g.82233  ORF Transcript_39268/g.82233 Transcript_39268/m.82233 type:complete len:237 (-) Transcript_39268:190-900(-)